MKNKYKNKKKPEIKYDAVEAPEKDLTFVGQLKFDAKQPKFNNQGWLMADAVIAQVGIVSRTDPETGEIRNEYISEEELFKQDSLDTLPAIDIEQHHKSVIPRGVVAGAPRKEVKGSKIFLVVPTAIKDKFVIQDVLNDITSEVSPEYTSQDIPAMSLYCAIEGLIVNKNENTNLNLEVERVIYELPNNGRRKDRPIENKEV